MFASVANCSELSAYQNCNIVGQYFNIARKRTSDLTVMSSNYAADENTESVEKIHLRPILAALCVRQIRAYEKNYASTLLSM